MTDDRDEFGDRMKGYEAVETERHLDPRLPICVRIDGRSFSTFTRDMDRPFDRRMSTAMIDVTKTLVRETHARIGYTQSDEISLVYLYDGPDSEALFGGKVHKLTSVLSSLATAALHRQIAACWSPEDATKLADRLPHFDARVFSVPSKVEASNAILWRALDARKNAVSMATRAHYSAKAMHLKDQAAMRAMLADKGVAFDDYPDFFKSGSFIRRILVQRQLSDAERDRIPEKHRPTPGMLVERTEIVMVPMPEFRLVANRVAVVFDGADPIEAPRLA